MPAQKPFLSNFLAAFRAHSQLPKAAPSISSSAAGASSVQTLWTSAAAASQSSNAQSPTSNAAASPRAIAAKSSSYGQLTTTGQQPQQQPQFQGPLSPLQHNVSPQTHLPRPPPSPGLPVYGPQNKPQPSYPTPQEARRARRGSDSSSDSGGFREARAGGNEKWFIGGRTAGGEERFYKLSMVRRDRSADRISADQLSL